MTTTIKRAMALGLAAALVAVGAASAETRVRIKNDSELPANITVDKRSRDVRPGKAGTFTIEGTNAVLKVAFANGDANKGDLDVSMEDPVTSAEDGNTYYCVILDTEHFEVTPKGACEAVVNKK